MPCTSSKQSYVRKLVGPTLIDIYDLVHKYGESLKNEYLGFPACKSKKIRGFVIYAMSSLI